ncbi:hypothetical protein [Streptomyces sp. NBC_00470]|uniref:hypothetical protein n=1 Tax=Streptomyces sp. NBC_00470 TaxID=2975753 RepID=UPI0030E2F043
MITFTEASAGTLFALAVIVTMFGIVAWYAAIQEGRRVRDQEAEAAELMEQWMEDHG